MIGFATLTIRPSGRHGDGVGHGVGHGGGDGDRRVAEHHAGGLGLGHIATTIGNAESGQLSLVGCVRISGWWLTYPSEKY